MVLIQLDPNQIITEPDYSAYTLRQLLDARRWFDAELYPDREGWLEEEIQKRCAHFQGTAKHRRSGAPGSSNRYRPYGLIFGIPVFAVSIGPMLVFQLLDTMGLTNGDNALLWGLWALLTLPIAVITFLIGGMMDTERVVRWLDL